MLSWEQWGKKKTSHASLLQEIETRGVRSDMLDISRLLQQLVMACQGHMARQPVKQSAACEHNYTQFYHTSQYSVMVSSCCVTSVCSLPTICSLYSVYAWIYVCIWVDKQTWLPYSCCESLASMKKEFKIEFALKIAFHCNLGLEINDLFFTSGTSD